MYLTIQIKNQKLPKCIKNYVYLDLDKKIKEEIDKHYKENLEEIRKIKEKIYKEIQ